MAADGNRDCLLSDVKAETLIPEPYYRHLQQEALLGVVTAEPLAGDPQLLRFQWI